VERRGLVEARAKRGSASRGRLMAARVLRHQPATPPATQAQVMHRHPLPAPTALEVQLPGERVRAGAGTNAGFNSSDTLGE